MAEHGIVFNVRVQMPGASNDTPGQIPYEQMMRTFDRTRNEGKKDGWHSALTALREAADKAQNPDAGRVLDDLIRGAAESRHCPYPRESRETHDGGQDA